MERKVLRGLFLCFLFFVSFLKANAQQQEKNDTIPPAKPPVAKDTILMINPVVNDKDTFFLAKKRGIIGRLAKSISVDPPGPKPVKIANPYLPYAGMVIRSIQLFRYGFDRNIYDTTIIKKGFGVKLGKDFHKITKSNIIANDLLFKAGDHLFPSLLADNERLLREEVYLQDARILVKLVPGSVDSVDIYVITKDVFSIGGSANIGGTTKGTFQVKEDNLNGSGSQLAGDFLYDQGRIPTQGYGAQYIQRNIRGSFIDWTTGFQTFAPAIANGLDEVTTIYTGFQKPLVSPYIPWTGALNVMFNTTGNAYNDTSYSSSEKYSFYDVDGWYGYNFGSKRLLYKNLKTRLRKFIAVRGFDMHFSSIPVINDTLYNYRYANVAGALTSLNIFKQDFYRTNFIYGFGRDEDVPEGFNASLVGGWTLKEGRHRPYMGLNGEITHFSKRGAYGDYTFRLGAYSYQHNLEDFDILISMNNFTALKKISSVWYNRNFITASITRQMNLALDQPLILQSSFGLPYFPTSTITMGDLRTSVGGQAVFFNMNKLLGFRFAPYVFSNLSLLTHTDMAFDKSDMFSAVGAGIRTRNENLTFGTFEIKGYYFPRTLPGMNEWRIEFNTNLQFKFNSTFIQEPDFITPN